MVSAVIPRWHGDNYQARIFWESALNLLDPTSCVVEVTFEADGPKAFDDVVVKYSPAVVRSGPDRISAEYHQVKWHVQYGGRFGYEDLINPEFIGAKKFSILERLMHARQSVPASTSRFAFITIDRIKDDDPLGQLISGNDKTLLIEKLFDGTTDASRMGVVRKLWREHLKLTSNDELRDIVSGFRIFEGHLSLDELRSQINLRAQVVGLLSCSNSSDFRYDELARQLKVRKLNTLTKEILVEFCRQEGLFSEPIIPDQYTPIAIRSFLGTASSVSGALEENTLILTEEFKSRYLVDGREWQSDIRPRVKAFLTEILKKSAFLRIILDAHASIAFLTGTILNTKSGTTVELIQKGRIGSTVWSAADGKQSEVRFVHESISIQSGSEIAVAISVSQNVLSATQQYIESHLPNVGKILSITLPGGPGQQNIAGGAHAAALAEQLSNVIRGMRASLECKIHIFAACPNALLFYLGQQSQGISPCLIYEYDFDREGNKSYQPSFLFD